MNMVEGEYCSRKKDRVKEGGMKEWKGKQSKEKDGRKQRKE